jgi:hypothetical protein
VLHGFLNRIRLSGWYFLVAAMALAASTGDPVHASAISSIPDCSASGGSLRCYLGGVLKFLYAAAGVLLVLLIGVVALAVKSYRKNKDDEKVGS